MDDTVSSSENADGSAHRADAVAGIERLARLLDSEYEIPFGFRVGWDGILGLVPVVGNLLTTAVSGYLIVQAGALGAAPSVLIRMLLNVVADDAIAAIPLVGWIGDFAWKSNERNVALLRRHLMDPATTARRSRGYLVAVAAIVFLFILAFTVATLTLAWWVIGRARELLPAW